jgi:uncharacterized RDD family membrane protein YckC
MWLYWQTKGRGDNDERPPLETYDRVCGGCGNKLLLHHALIHLLNASGYRDVDVSFDHTMHLAKFANCPFCFSGIGWHPGKPPPDEDISPEVAMKMERIERLREKLETPAENPVERRNRISEVLKKRGSVDTSFAEFIEISSPRNPKPSEEESETTSPKIKPLYPEKPEWVFGAEPRLNAPIVKAEQIDAAVLEVGVDFHLQDLENETAESHSKNSEAAKVEISFENIPDPQFEGVARCPNHPEKNADRTCPLCYRNVCVNCMAFVEGVSGCRDCFGDYKIRRMYDIPNDWQKRRSVELEPEKLPDRYAGFGIIKIESEGAPATSTHRFIAHAIDGLLAAAILGFFQLIYSFPLNHSFVGLSDMIIELADRQGEMMLNHYSHAEAAGRALGFDRLFNLGIKSGAVWWIAGWPILAWIFAGLIPATLMRSPGQHLCNLAVVDASGRWISPLAALYRALLAIPAVLSFGFLAILNYRLGQAGASLTDTWMHTRVVTFSGRRWVPPRDMRVVRVALFSQRTEQENPIDT